MGIWGWEEYVVVWGVGIVGMKGGVITIWCIVEEVVGMVDELGVNWLN